MLVTGAGSGVATFAVQIAAAVGSEVWVTTSTGAQLARLRELGARGGALYSHGDWGSRLREAAGGRFDAVVDSWGCGRLARRVAGIAVGWRARQLW